MFSNSLILCALIPIYIGYFLIIAPFLTLIIVPAATPLILFSFAIFKIYNSKKFWLTKSHFGSAFPHLKLDTQSINPIHEFSCQREVGIRLSEAQKQLPNSIRFLLLNCYNSLDKDVSEPIDSRFEITLTDNLGFELDLGRGEVNHDFNIKPKSKLALTPFDIQKLKNQLRETLIYAGFINDPTYWWQWSFAKA